jgi:hypothetical protein
MENNKWNQLWIAIVLIALAYNMYQTHSINKRIDGLTLNSTTTIITDKGIILPDGFDDVKVRFERFNPHIDTNTVITFLNVVDEYKLRNDQFIFDALIGQILTESGARQFHIKGHASEGKVVRGTSGEVGISQIMPQTAQFYLRKLHDRGENLPHADDFSFIGDKSFSKTTMDELTIKWLSDVNNNLALWGYIMREHLDEMGLFESLIAYNTGKGGMKKFVQENDPDTHSYVQKIMGVVFEEA